MTILDMIIILNKMFRHIPFKLMPIQTRCDIQNSRNLVGHKPFER